MIFDVKWTNFGLGDDNFITITCILAVIILYGIYELSQKDNNFLQPLPGPTGLPIVGYLPFLGPKPYKVLTKLAKKYGPAYQIKLGSRHCLVLCSYEAVRDSIIKQSHIYSGRPENLTLKVYDHESAFIFDEGPSFKDVRQFSMDALKRLGFGRLSSEHVVKFEVQDLITELTQLNGEPADVSHTVTRSVGNAICTLLLGKRSSMDNPWLHKLIDIIDGLKRTTMYDYSFFFPLLKELPFLGKFTNDKEKRYWKDTMWKVWQEKIDEAKEDVAGGTASESFITAWFKEAEKRECTNDPHTHLYSDINLRSNLDIFAQGSFETTTTTILWGLQYLIDHPEVQEKMYTEITKCLGGTEFDFSFTESKNMPYTKAVIQEIHRLSSITPLGLFHRTSDESELLGYKVPKGTLVLICHYAVHNDPDHFSDPSQFKPERFLTENGEYVKSESVIPFSVGKRFCPGEFVAQMEIFHYLTAIVYEFVLELGPNNKNFGLSTDKTQITSPLPFTIQFKPRQK